MQYNQEISDGRRVFTMAFSAAMLLSGCAADHTSPSDSDPFNTDPGAGGTDSESANTPRDTDNRPDPVAACEAPSLEDVSVAPHVVGNGTEASCTAAALENAVKNGGAVTFDCGESPVTITVTRPVTITKETVLYGDNRVTLSGGGRSRIIYFDSAYDLDGPRLTVQRLTFRDGNSPAGEEDTAVGGGAIYRDGGSLTVIDCTFIDNRAPAEGQDIAGGAIYGFGGGETVISGSAFLGNSASNGGAVGSLNSHLTVVNSLFDDNRATGTDGNPGNGGCGGAIYMDGTDEATRLCGITVTNNRAGAIGGGIFRVSNDKSGTFEMRYATVDGNAVTPADAGNAGGLYLQGLALTIEATTISRNEAFYNGGIWIHTCDTAITNVTIAENTAFGSNGGGIWLSGPPTGTLLNTTIAGNRATADDQISGAIFGEGLTLKNTLIADNTAMWVPGCNETHPSDGGNLQWPDGALCVSDPLVSDPHLGSLTDNGGETETLLPAKNSPADNLGADCPSTDQRGRPRSEPCTAGAVEI